MRWPIVSLIGVLVLTMPAYSQNPATPSSSNIPASIGNRANGFSYQPTQAQVRAREKTAGVALSNDKQRASDVELWKLDRRALRSEGQRTNSVPNSRP
jgi:hypothetical protein